MSCQHFITPFGTPECTPAEFPRSRPQALSDCLERTQIARATQAQGVPAKISSEPSTLLSQSVPPVHSRTRNDHKELPPARLSRVCRYTTTAQDEARRCTIWESFLVIALHRRHADKRATPFNTKFPWFSRNPTAGEGLQLHAVRYLRGRLHGPPHPGPWLGKLYLREYPRTDGCGDYPRTDGCGDYPRTDGGFNYASAHEWLEGRPVSGRSLFWFVCGGFCRGTARFFCGFGATDSGDANYLHSTTMKYLPPRSRTPLAAYFFFISFLSSSCPRDSPPPTAPSLSLSLSLFLSSPSHLAHILALRLFCVCCLFQLGPTTTNSPRHRLRLIPPPRRKRLAREAWKRPTARRGERRSRSIGFYLW